MKALISSYQIKDNGRDTVYVDKVPQQITTQVSFPLQFIYVHQYNAMVIKGTNIQIDNILSIDVIG